MLKITIQVPMHAIRMIPMEIKRLRLAAVTAGGFLALAVAAYLGWHLLWMPSQVTLEGYHWYSVVEDHKGIHARIMDRRHLLEHDWLRKKYSEFDWWPTHNTWITATSLSIYRVCDCHVPMQLIEQAAPGPLETYVLSNCSCRNFEKLPHEVAKGFGVRQ